MCIYSFIIYLFNPTSIPFVDIHAVAPTKYVWVGIGKYVKEWRFLTFSSSSVKLPQTILSFVEFKIYILYK